MITKKYIDKFVKIPVRNIIGKKWIKHNLLLRGKKQIFDEKTDSVTLMI